MNIFNSLSKRIPAQCDYALSFKEIFQELSNEIVLICGKRHKYALKPSRASKRIMRNSIVLIMIITWLCSCGRRINFETSKVAIDSDRQRSLIHDLEKSSGYHYIYTDTTYASSTGKGITIQNGVPKGGNIEPRTPYIDSTGKQYFFAAFWTRIVNQTDTCLELKVNFPGDSFSLSPASDPYLKLFLPPDTMTIDKLPLYSYGLTGMKSYVDANFSNATGMSKIIKPNEEHMFYIVTVSFRAGGPARSALFLKQKELFYRISMGSYGPLEIPCGTITYVN